VLDVEYQNRERQSIFIEARGTKMAFGQAVKNVPDGRQSNITEKYWI
jgi:hypothetical protein